MNRDRPDPARDRGSAGWALYLAIPAMLLCCVGPLVVGALGASAFAAFWARGYGYLGIALLVLAGAAVALWHRTRGPACCAPTAEVRHASGAARTAPAPKAAVVGRPAQRP